MSSSAVFPAGCCGGVFFFGSSALAVGRVTEGGLGDLRWLLDRRGFHGGPLLRVHARHLRRFVDRLGGGLDHHRRGSDGGVQANGE